MDSDKVITIYEPNENEIEQVSLQLPDSVSRDEIINVLKRTKGNINEAILIVLTNDNVIIPKQTNVKRQFPKNEIILWENFFKEVEQYKKVNNITGLQNRNANDPFVQTSIEFEDSTMKN